jgi:predicted lipase
MEHREKIFQEVEKYGVKNLTIKGYSLGGFWAKVFAVDAYLRYENRKIKALLFGDPKCGNKKFAKLYDSLIKDSSRYRYGMDIVPLLPFSILGYKGEGTVKQIGPKRKWWQIRYWFKDHCEYRRYDGY